MLSTCVRFFSAVLLVALTAPIASADLPTRELIDPLYLAGDPHEPERAGLAQGPDAVRFAPERRPSNRDTLTTVPSRAILLSKLRLLLWTLDGRSLLV